MNYHAQMPGQMSGQVPNQAGNQFPGISLPSGGSATSQLQTGGLRNARVMDPDIMRDRALMQQKIFECLMRRHPQTHEIQSKRVQDLVKRLEDGLFRSALSMEQYTNLDTLESRLHSLLKRSPMNSRNQQPAPSPVGTMIPTPGMSHSGNPNVMVTSSVATPMNASTGGSSGIAISTVNTGSSLVSSTAPSHGMLNGSFTSTNGFFPNGYQNRNTLISSTAAQRSSSQMIPTPGFNGSDSHSYVSSESSKVIGGLTGGESTTLAQQLPQNPHVSGHNGNALNHLGNGNQIPGGIRSNVQKNAYGFANRTVNSGNPSGTGSLYSDVTSVGSMRNPCDLNSGAPPSISNSKSPLVSNQSNLQSTQHSDPQPTGVLGKVKLESPASSFGQAQQTKPLERQLTQFRQQLIQQQQNQHSQQHSYLLNNDTPIHGQHSSNHKMGLEQSQLADLQNHIQQTSRLQNPLPHGSSQMQQSLYPQALVVENKNELNTNSIGSQLGSVLQDQLHSQAKSWPQISHEQHIQEDFHQRIISKDEAQHNDSLLEGSLFLTGRSGNSNRERQFKNQRRWLLFLRHARHCTSPEGKCQDVNCVTVQKLWRHIERCNAVQCPHPRCHNTKILLHHFKHCTDSGCPVCVPVRNFIHGQRKATPNHPCTESDMSIGSCRSAGEPTSELIPKIPAAIECSDNAPPSAKRVKMETSSESLLTQCENLTVSCPPDSKPHFPREVKSEDPKNSRNHALKESDFPDLKMEGLLDTNPENLDLTVMKKEIMADIKNQQPDKDLVLFDESAGRVKENDTEHGNGSNQAEQKNVPAPAEQTVGTKSGKPKIKGVSLIELFSPEQVKEHIIGLRKWIGQSKAKAERNQAMEHSMSENSCQLCAVERLTFEPPPLYCTPCGARIKRNAMYYTVGAGETRHFFCIPCYNDARGETILADNTPILKSKLDKKKNDDETEEWWVQCDKCEAWQHQICALFNGRRNDGGQAEYTCPNCYMAEVERGERRPLPQSTVLGAKDLPRTILSDHIEQRLFKKLKQERQDRAKAQGKTYDEVPGADALVVRVVSSVDKKLEVKPRFMEIFREENYPTEYPYKSKVVLLFQKIEGVEVCLFGMYVQEFGSECLLPNQRRVYLSYLDSVKYFRPDIKAVTGEALRTFVYHEILIGYLEYCKKRGFSSCYIWACPPLKGEDYILYCHPEIQKTPKSDKLREWYLSMLKKATKENIVVELTNLYEHFFTCTGECKAKVTAARLPYFDGDYWPGAAEDFIYQLSQEEDGRKQNKKGTIKKTISKRALKVCGQSDPSASASKDLMLMHKLGETISPMKEDFIMVHLQYACSHCCVLMVSGNRWVCSQCKNFQLCDKCHEAEQKCEERDRHPVHYRDAHEFYPVEIHDVPPDTKDDDEILESEFFDTRQAFLSLCQGNHYQYDTLRRAKHSSMMVLYHLHNPTAPAFVISCSTCFLDIETGQGWHCEICPDYDMCNTCYQKNGGIDHPHKLTNHPSMAERDAQNKEARQLRVLQLRKMLDLLVHASQCRSPNCQYPNCRKVKGLFRHGIQCKIRASGGCVLCKKMWYLLQLHSRACKESECTVPRCRDLKDHMRRLQQQSDSRRRAAVMEMMRQRRAEVAGNGG